MSRLIPLSKAISGCMFLAVIPLSTVEGAYWRGKISSIDGFTRIFGLSSRQKYVDD
jgi:hypothetical protein